MAFLLLIIFQCLHLLRPLEWGGAYDEEAFPITSLVLVIGLAFMYVKKSPKHYSVQFWLMLAMSFVIIVSAALNLWLGAALEQFQLFIIIAIIPILLYSNLVDSNFKQEIMMAIFTISALIMLSNGISQQSASDGIGWAGSSISQESRITYLGILEDPNDLGGFFVMCFPFALYFFTYGKGFLIKTFGAFSSLAMLYGVFLTNSRGALLAILTIMGSYILYRYGKGKTFILGLISLPIIGLVLSMFRAIDSEEASAEGRIDAWYQGFQMLAANPIFGVGYGEFIEYNEITAHNSFILVMSELGVAGYALWFSMVGLSFYMMYKILIHYQQLQRDNGFKKIPEKEQSELSSAYAINSTLFFSMVGYFATAFFLSRSYHFLTFFLCAIAVASYQHVTTLQPELKIKDIRPEIRKLFLLSFASIIALNVVVKVFI